MFALFIVALPIWAEKPWNLDALSKAPQAYPAEGFSAEGMKALFYEGPPYKGKPTRVFAWYGAPEAKGGEKLPAMVLIHGGGGTAFHDWVRLWNKRGYAAIAMDTCGCVPKGEYGHWERHESGGPPGWGGFDQGDDPVQDRWTYHAVADAVLAHSLVRSFPGVDPERTGVTGISWGGYLTCIVAGVDNRFKCAVPVYGCGFLDDDSAWLDTFKGLGEEKTRQWIALWDPSVYLTDARMPMLWVTGTNDFAYPMDSLRKSYRLPRGPRQLCLRMRMPHGHGGAGENPEEIHIFADSFFKGGVPLPKIADQGRDGNNVWATYKSEAPIVKAELTYTKAAGVWKERPWESIPATVDAGAHKVAATLPEGTTVYYLNLFDNRDAVVSSEHEVLTEN
ncbi:MAG: acetylxylan esterase [Candidatus Hydrogenedentes bacterium]|nr:acetylxylan esterase [Candidatus Hydrogenedentota bacterium]